MSVSRMFRTLRIFRTSLSFYGAGNTAKYVWRHVLFSFGKHILGRSTLQRKIHDYKMAVATEGLISKKLYLYGSHEDDHRLLLRNELSDGTRVLDLGANIGYFALMEASIVGETGKVFAVEPDPRNLELLRRNVRLNRVEDIVEVFDFAMSNRNGEARFGIHRQPNLNTVLLGDEDIEKDGFIEVKKLQTVDIYDFLQEIAPIHLIRMDIEGHEVAIFEALCRLWKNSPDCVPHRILFEVHPDRYVPEEWDLRPKLATLLDAGFEVSFVTTFDENQSSHVKGLGYKVWKETFSEYHKRGIYRNIRREDVVDLLCETGCIRAALLKSPSAGP